MQTEGKAGLRVKSYADKFGTPCWPRPSRSTPSRKAATSMSFANLVQAYGIVLAPEPEYVPPRDAEWAFMVTGYSECIDSFFAFGLFEAAAAPASSRRSWLKHSNP